MKQDMPREYAEIICASWNRDPWSRPDFCHLMSPLQVHPRFFDEQSGPAVGAIDYMRGSGN